MWEIHSQLRWIFFMGLFRRCQVPFLLCCLVSFQLGCGALSGFQGDDENPGFIWGGEPSADGGATPDVSAADGGPPMRDASLPDDAGGADGGESPGDGGAPPDGGTRLDGGEWSPDAGAVMDAGDPDTCAPGLHLEDGRCVSNSRSCPVTYGTGMQTWSSGGWGMCSPVSCEPEYHLEFGICNSNWRSCVVEEMMGFERWENGIWGACTVVPMDAGVPDDGATLDEDAGRPLDAGDITEDGGTSDEDGGRRADGGLIVDAGGTGDAANAQPDAGDSVDAGLTPCPSGEHAENENCIPDIDACAEAHGTGTRTWTGTSWGACTLTNCDVDYHLESGDCVSDVRACSNEGQTGAETWSGGVWGTCHIWACGNGSEEGDEECDDGNVNDHDSCLSSCQIARCGDGYVYVGEEECDDGNVADGDGCNNSCVVEDSYFCGGTPTLCAPQSTSYEWNESSGPPSLSALQNGVTTVFVRVDQQINWKLAVPSDTDSFVGSLTIVGEEGTTLRSADETKPVLEFHRFPGPISIYNLEIDGTTPDNKTSNGIVVNANDLFLENVRIQDVTNAIMSTSAGVTLRNVEIQSATGTGISVTTGDANLKYVQIRDVTYGIRTVLGETLLRDVQIQNASECAVQITSGDLTLRGTEISHSNRAIEITNDDFQGRTSENRIFRSWMHHCAGDNIIKLRGNTWMANSVLSDNSGSQIVRAHADSHTLVSLSTFYNNTGPSVLHTHGNMYVVASLFEHNSGVGETHHENAQLHFKRSHLDHPPERKDDKGADGHPKNEAAFSTSPNLYCHEINGCVWDRDVSSEGGHKSFEPQFADYADVLPTDGLPQLVLSLAPEPLRQPSCNGTDSSMDESQKDACWKALFGPRTDFHGTPRPFGNGIEPGAVEIISIGSENSGAD